MTFNYENQMADSIDRSVRSGTHRSSPRNHNRQGRAALSSGYVWRNDGSPGVLQPRSPYSRTGQPYRRRKTDRFVLFRYPYTIAFLLLVAAIALAVL